MSNLKSISFLTPGNYPDSNPHRGLEYGDADDLRP